MTNPNLEAAAKAIYAAERFIWNEAIDLLGNQKDADRAKAICAQLRSVIDALSAIEGEWRDMDSAPRDGALMLLELDDGSIKLGRHRQSPVYSFLWWSENGAALSEPRRWCPIPPPGGDNG